MKFVLTAEGMSLAERGQIDAYEHAGQTIWSWMGDKLADGIASIFTDLLNIITANMPEIGAFITIICGVGIMLTGNFAKWFMRWGFAMLGAVIWLLNA